MRSYDAARSLFSFLGFVAWVAILLGIVAALVGAGAGGTASRWGGGPTGLASLIGALPGIAIIFSGFLGLAAVQMGRASVDTAEYTQQMLKIARDQLDVSQQALKQASNAQRSFADRTEASVGTDGSRPNGQTRQEPKLTNTSASYSYKIGETIIYRGKEIRVTEGGYVFDRIPFHTIDEARASIDVSVNQQSLAAQKKPPYAEQIDVNPHAIGDTLKRT